MKKIFTLPAKRFLALFLFLLAQLKTWAVDTTTATTIDKTSSTFSQPWIWIGIAVILAIKFLGPFTEDSKNFVVIRKKPTRKGIV